MPKIGMEPIRRKALVHAAITEIGRVGSTDVTVAQIARRAGVSSALAHHYFGSKDSLLLSAMRHILEAFGREVRNGLRSTKTPRQRLGAIVRACFTPENFKPEVARAWLNFYVLAHSNPEARRLLSVYHRRLHSNLVCSLRPMVGDAASSVAASTAAFIDGIYLRQVLGERPYAEGEAEALIKAHVDMALKG